MKKLPFLFLLTLLCFAFVAATVASKAVYDRTGTDRALDKRTSSVTQYSFPRTGQAPVRTEKVLNEDDLVPEPSRPVSLGAVAGGEASPGITVRETYEDWQYSVKAHYIDFSQPPGPPSVQFTYTDLVQADVTKQHMAYNVYDPTGTGGWPRGINTGCVLGAADEQGRYASSDVTSDGLIVLAGEDNAGGDLDNHMYGNTSLHSCFWSGGSVIPAEQYTAGFVDGSGALRHPIVEVQEWGGDVIVHVVAHEQTFFTPDAGAPAVTEVVIQYFRTVNAGQMGATTSWEGPLTIDSANYRGVIAASSVSGKVAIAYNHHTSWAFSENNGSDCDVFYRESTNGGADWGGPTNITNYNRVERSYGPWIEVQPFYDSDGYLHVLWNANPYPEDVYNAPGGFFFNDFTCSLLHWTSRTDLTSRVSNREYGINWNTQVCGFGGANTMYLAFFNIAECNGRLYVIYSGWNDIYADPPIINDCASSFGTAPSRVYQANGEIYMRVSTTKDGLLWDAERNLTNTYTPGCDSLGFGGVCMNDTKVMLAKYGMDVTAYPGALTWPGAELLVVDPEYTGSHYLHMFYLEDHFPGNFGIGRGDATNNDLKWIRLGCVDPVTAPQIAFTPAAIGFPSWVHHGAADTVTVEVVNDGNTTLTVDSIVLTETSPVSGWLAASATDLTISAGVGNTATFDVYLNHEGNIDSPGSIVALNGAVSMWSDAPEPRDSVAFVIVDFLVADTVVGLAFDTLSTAATARSPEELDFVELIVTSNGEMGFNGNGGPGTLNLDYVSADTLIHPGDCDVGAAVYLYSGSPIIVQDVPGEGYRMSYSMHAQGFATDHAFYPVTGGADPESIDGPNYQAYFTGTFVNWDSTLAVEKTTYAPTGGGDSAFFMIQKVQVFSNDGNPHDSLVFGEVIDWDIPASTGSNNNGIPNAKYRTIYYQGTDDVADTLRCQDHANRWGTQAFLGMYTNVEYNTNNCVNDMAFVGAFAGRNDSNLFIDDTLQPPRFWQLMGSLTGYDNGMESENGDLHGVVTFKHNVTLGAADTMTFYSVVSTVQNGLEADMDARMEAARVWYSENLRPGCGDLFGCCVEKVGNVDGDPGEVVDIGDLTALIDYLFITKPAPELPCPEEANIDGDTEGVIDIGDLTALIDYLFITKPAPPLNACP